MNPPPNLRVTGLAAIALIAHDAHALARFYEDVLGFSRIEEARLSGSGFEARVGAPGSARAIFLRLGAQRLELVQFDRPGPTYPDGISGDDPRFQHFAVVVCDMAAAWALLKEAPGWTPISSEGPVRLPPASGGAQAMKFRDLEGHPLELLCFAEGATPEVWRGRPGLFLGIDHSAVSVADAARSIDFYGRLGLGVVGRSRNVGPEQARLDGIAGAEAQVVALAPEQPTPHLELLAYVGSRPMTPVGATDVAATRLIFAGDAAATFADPDGHRLVILP